MMLYKKYNYKVMNKSTRKKSTRKKVNKKKSTRKNTIKKGRGKEKKINITSLPLDIFKYTIPEMVDTTKLRQTSKKFLDIYNTPLSKISSLHYISKELHDIMEKGSDIHRDIEEIIDETFNPSVSFTINGITFYIFPCEYVSPSKTQISKIYAHYEYDLTATFTKLTSKETFVLNDEVPTPFTNHEMGDNILTLFQDVKIERIPKNSTLSSEQKIFTIIKRLENYFNDNSEYETKNITFSYTSKDMDSLYEELKNIGMPHDIKIE